MQREWTNYGRVRADASRRVACAGRVTQIERGTVSMDSEKRGNLIRVSRAV